MADNPASVELVTNLRGHIGLLLATAATGPVTDDERASFHRVDSAVEAIAARLAELEAPERRPMFAPYWSTGVRVTAKVDDEETGLAIVAFDYHDTQRTFTIPIERRGDFDELTVGDRLELRLLGDAHGAQVPGNG